MDSHVQAPSPYVLTAIHYRSARRPILGQATTPLMVPAKSAFVAK